MNFGYRDFHTLNICCVPYYPINALNVDRPEWNGHDLERPNWSEQLDYRPDWSAVCLGTSFSQHGL